MTKNNFWKGLGFGILASTAIFFLILWLIFQLFLNGVMFFLGAAPDGQAVIVNCEDDYKIKQASTKGFAFVAGTTHSTSTLLIKDSIAKNIFQEDTSIKLPLVSKLREKFATKESLVIKDIDPDLKELSKEARFIFAEKDKTEINNSSNSQETGFSQKEFEIIIYCLSKNYQKFTFLPSTVLYGHKKPSKFEGIYSIFWCYEKNKITMGTLKLYSDGGIDYFERKNSTGMFDLQIGKFNQANIFTRYPGKI